MRRLPVIVGITFSTLLVACATTVNPPEDVSAIRLIAPDGRTITVRAEFARTPAEQQRGLMERTELASDAGMLFIFPQNQVLSFWMKDTLMALDILFFDDVGRFVSGLTMSPCPPQIACPTYVSQGSARYALEVPAGSIRQWGVGDGWKLALGPWASS